MSCLHQQSDTTASVLCLDAALTRYIVTRHCGHHTASVLCFTAALTQLHCG